MSFAAKTTVQFHSAADLENALKIDPTPFSSYLGMPMVLPPDLTDLQDLKICRDWQMLDRCNEYVEWTKQQFQAHNITATITIEEYP